ncbi:hypothetical protein K1T71_009139 [Dendrolimus kikuchii]|uniref:Uncharacterized protein n=1 Tax=Dendrolimus kikuchii TaxID=765133 RepID=A0ACC1CTL2_9NEOP|nr:hypothetical protein K1T71_009139 [Dendrolimus kikuchii]
MKIFIIVMLILSVTVLEYQMMNSTISDVCANEKNLRLTRRRRQLTFPDGSTVVLTISLVKAFMTHAPSGWNIALEIDVLYPLPDKKFINSFFRRKFHHRQKRELWEKLEAALDFHNINGRSCIFRSVCETEKYLAPPGKSLVHDILRAIFTAPLREEEFKAEMGLSYTELLDPDICEKENGCPFSVLDFILDLNKR